jgi:hypothetical protein
MVSARAAVGIRPFTAHTLGLGLLGMVAVSLTAVVLLVALLRYLPRT